MKKINYLFILALLFSPLLITTSQAQGRTYKVQPGDSLSRIAERFGLSLNQISQLNGITDANDIGMGENLYISLKDVTIVGDALINILPSRRDPVSQLTTSIREDIDELVAQDNADISTETSTEPAVFTDVTWPDTYPSPITDMSFSLTEASEGESFGLNVTLNQPAVLNAHFVGQEFPFLAEETGFSQNAVLAVPVGQQPGVYPLDIQILSTNGFVQNLTLPMTINANSYETERVSLPLRSTSSISVRTNDLEMERISEVCANFDPIRRWDSGFRYPTNSPSVSSEFGLNRFYRGSPSTSVHSGIDLRANRSTAVHASAGGVVRSIEDLRIRGNTLIIDHGMGLCSAYTHVRNITVSEGDVVTKGQVIASAGSTGLAAITEVHWELYVMGIPVDPEQWVQE